MNVAQFKQLGNEQLFSLTADQQFTVSMTDIRKYVILKCATTAEAVPMAAGSL